MPRVAAPFAERARACPSGLPQMPASCRCGRAHTCAPSCTATCRARSRLHGTWPSLGEKRGWMDGQDGVGQQVATQGACVVQREVEKAGRGLEPCLPLQPPCCAAIVCLLPTQHPTRTAHQRAVGSSLLPNRFPLLANLPGSARCCHLQPNPALAAGGVSRGGGGCSSAPPAQAGGARRPAAAQAEAAAGGMRRRTIAANEAAPAACSWQGLDSRAAALLACLAACFSLQAV